MQHKNYEEILKEVEERIKTMYRSTSCGTLNKSGVSQVLPRLLSPSSSVVFSYCTPFQSTF